METKHKYILAGVAAVAVALGAAGAFAKRGDGDWGHRFSHGMMHRGGAGPLAMMGFAGFGGPSHRVCRQDSSEMADHMIVRLEHRVKPTDAQKPAFDELKTAIHQATDKMQQACPKQTADAEATPPTPIERLAQAETSLTASLDALKAFRPAAEKFYATLSPEQKAKLAERPNRFGRDKRGPDAPSTPGGDKSAPDDATPPDKG